MPLEHMKTLLLELMHAVNFRANAYYPKKIRACDCPTFSAYAHPHISLELVHFRACDDPQIRACAQHLF